MLIGVRYTGGRALLSGHSPPRRPDGYGLETYGLGQTMPVQISVMSEGGSGTPVPDLSIEVDNLDATLARVKKAKIPIEYGPVDEPWGCADSSYATPSARWCEHPCPQ